MIYSVSGNIPFKTGNSFLLWGERRASHKGRIKEKCSPIPIS